MHRRLEYNSMLIGGSSEAVSQSTRLLREKSRILRAVPTRGEHTGHGPRPSLQSPVDAVPSEMQRPSLPAESS